MAFLAYHTGLSPSAFLALGHRFTRAFSGEVAKVWMQDVKVRAGAGGF